MRLRVRGKYLEEKGLVGRKEMGVFEMGGREVLVVVMGRRKSGHFRSCEVRRQVSQKDNREFIEVKTDFCKLV